MSEEDFNSLKLDRYCLSAVAKQSPVDRIFRCWEESWEKVKVRRNGDQCHSACLAAKYGNLCWIDADMMQKPYTSLTLIVLRLQRMSMMMIVEQGSGSIVLLVAGKSLITRSC